MKNLGIALILTALAGLLAACGSQASAEGKRIALTFDDAPRPDGGLYSGTERTQKLIQELEKAGVEEAAIFVTTRNVNPGNNGAARLQAYVKAGHVLANHSHSHMWFHQTPTEDYIADMDAAIETLKRFENVRPWYRFPYLDEGRGLEKRDAMRAALKERGLMNGYVTVDTYDWHIAGRLAEAAREGKSIDYEGLRQLYVDVILDSATFYEEMAQKTLGRSPAHVLLLHENDLNALFIADVVAALRADGWDIISPTQAFEDPIADHEPDTLFLGQGRIAAIAHEKGTEPKALISKTEDTDYLDGLIAERGVFAGAIDTGMGAQACAVKPKGMCTRDLNPCGHASRCTCEPGYAYNSALGLCVVELSRASGRLEKVDLPDSACVVAPRGACTKDINACGLPSRCGCPEGFEWNAAVGKCVRALH